MNVGWRVSVTLMNSIDTLSKYTDTTRLESLAKDYLFKKHNLFKAKAILFGTGVEELIGTVFSI